MPAGMTLKSDAVVLNSKGQYKFGSFTALTLIVMKGAELELIFERTLSYFMFTPSFFLDRTFVMIIFG